MADLKIRLGEEGDAGVIAGFNRRMALETEGVELLEEGAVQGVRRLFERPEMGFYVVAEKGSQIVASLMVTYEWSDWRDGVVWWVQSVYVLPEFRRQGIYRNLYEYVKGLALEEEDVRGIRLYVDKGNETAQRTYRSLGMEETDYRLYEEMFPRR